MRKLPDVFKNRDFLWGSGTAAYQCEGAWNKDGKGVGEWDYFNHHSVLNINNVNGDDASDFYHRYKEDIDLMAVHKILLDFQYPGPAYYQMGLMK